MENKKVVLPDSGTRTTFGENSALREPSTGKGRPALMTPFALERIAKHYENGAVKYSEHNWAKGMPFSRYTDSGFRHLLAWMKGDSTEDHLAAICWNFMAIMHHQELGETQWNDMPEYKKSEE